MKWLGNRFVLVAGFLVVFWEASFQGIRHLLGAQIDLLPSLMVYASLNAGLGTIASLAVCGGLWFDSLSANPLGITIFPLMVIGVAIFSKRELIVRDQTFARMVLGLIASLL